MVQRPARKSLSGSRFSTLGGFFAKPRYYIIFSYTVGEKVCILSRDSSDDTFVPNPKHTKIDF